MEEGEVECKRTKSKSFYNERGNDYITSKTDGI